MPFLAKKTVAQPAHALSLGALGTAHATWGDDEYRPSQRASGLSDGRLSLALTQTTVRGVCASAECASGWRAPWRNRRRPIFEGQWGCSGRCLLTMVRAALRRESGEGRQVMPDTPHRHRVPLGLVLLGNGWITHPQLRRALDMQRDSGRGLVGEWLVSECGVESDLITRALSMQWGCPVLKTDGFAPDAMALAMPRIFVESFGMLPIRVAGSSILYVGFTDRLNHSLALALEQMTMLKVESGVVEKSEWEASRMRLLGCDEVEATVERSQGVDAMAARVTAILEQKQPVASQIVAVHGSFWLRLWLERGAFGQIGNMPATREDVRDYIFQVSSMT